MAAHDEASERRAVSRQTRDREPEVEAGTLPRDPSELAAEDLTRQPLALSCRRNGNDGVGMHVIDMAVRAERMERRVDARGARVQIERAVRKVRRHLAFVSATRDTDGRGPEACPMTARRTRQVPWTRDRRRSP